MNESAFQAAVLAMNIITVVVGGGLVTRTLVWVVKIERKQAQIDVQLNNGVSKALLVLSERVQRHSDLVKKQGNRITYMQANCMRHKEETHEQHSEPS